MPRCLRIRVRVRVRVRIRVRVKVRVRIRVKARARVRGEVICTHLTWVTSNPSMDSIAYRNP